MPTQLYNSEAVGLMAAHVPLRLDSTYAWGQAIGGMLLAPGLRGLWSGSSIDEHKGIVDLSGQGRELVAINTLTQGRYGIAPYVDFTRASSEYLNRVTEPGLEITTTGLTLWTWIRFHTQSTGQWASVISKWGIIPNYGYIIGKGPNDRVAFTISSTGADNITAVALTPTDYTYAIDTWYFLAGRFTPSTEIALFVGRATDGWYTWMKDVAAIPAAIFSTDADFMIGSDDGVNNYLDGDMSLFGISAVPLLDTEIWNMFSQSRPLWMHI